jgi:hypothetical protein
MMARLIVTAVLILVVAGIVLGTAGVLHYRDTPDQTTVTFDKREFREKSREAADKTAEMGRQTLDRTGQAFHDVAEQLRGAPNGNNAPSNTSAPNGSRQAKGGQPPADHR